MPHSNLMRHRTHRRGRARVNIQEEHGLAAIVALVRQIQGHLAAIEALGYDLERKQRKDKLLLYDSKDLVTHAVCVGMTGSGKTGLCIGLLEEAAIDGIPAIVIDPKGDQDLREICRASCTATGTSLPGRRRGAHTSKSTCGRAGRVT